MKADRASASLTPRVLGLAGALFGPGLIAWGASRFASGRIELQTVWLAAFIGLTIFVICMGRVEGLGWRELGFRGFTWVSVPLSILLSAFLIFVFGPFAYWLATQLPSHGFDEPIAALRHLPRWYLMVSVVLVAASEEWLYRGYAIERLESLTGSTWGAGAVSLGAFALAHLPVWGAGPSVTTLLSGGVLTALYLWRRDVSFLIVAHVATDFYGIVVAPPSAV